MRTIKSKSIPETKDKRDNKKVDDDYAARYIKKELKEW